MSAGARFSADAVLRHAGAVGDASEQMEKAAGPGVELPL